MCKHLKEHNIGYFKHLARAFKMGSYSIVTGLILIIHGLFPFVWDKLGTSRISLLFYRVRRLFT